MKKSFLIGLFFILLVSSFVSAAENTVSQNISEAGERVVVPDVLKSLAAMLFNLKSTENMDFSFFIILIVVWICLFLLMGELISLTPFFESGWKKWLAGIIVTLLVSISGGLNELSAVLLIWGDIFKAVDKWGVAKTVFVVLVLGIFVWGTTKLLEMLKRKIKAGEYSAEAASAEISGIKVGIKSKLSR